MLVLVVGATILWRGTFDASNKIGRAETKNSATAVSNSSSLLALPVDRLREVDIGKMNLLCAQGLVGAEDLDVDRSLTVLDEMAARARSETERHLYRFERNPAEFENSEGFFRMIMLAVVLAEDFHVQYTPNKIGTAANAHIGDGFFADAHDVFLHGLTGPRRQGTCSSLPVLQVAIGRRLGYPLKLVTTKGHLFVRWEGPRERFNIEAAGKGVNRLSDDYYRHWPLAVTEQEIQADGYLKSLSPAEELAVFLSIRAMCLSEAKCHREAAECFASAARLAPGCRSYQTMQEQLSRRAGGSRTAVSPATVSTPPRGNGSVPQTRQF